MSGAAIKALNTKRKKMNRSADKNDHGNFLKEYLKNAPVSLALIRALECRIMDRIPFMHPMLDLGSGDGLFASVLFKNKDFVDCAIDSSESEVDLSYKRGVYREIKVAEAEDIPYNDESFKFVMANDLLAHVKKPSVVLNEAWRVLEKDGMLCFTVPTLVPKFHADLFSKFIASVAQTNIIKLFNHNIGSYFRLNSIYAYKKWDALLKESGFTVVQHKKYASLSAIIVQMITSYYLYRGIAYKKTIGRYIPFPDLHEKIVTPITSWLLESLYKERSYEGENYMILARKNA